MTYFRAQGGEVEYMHENGEITTVTITLAGLRRRQVRIANLPPELPNEIIKEHRTKYGIVHGVTEEKWSTMYRYAVGNGIRIATVELKSHIPSNIHIDGYRTLVSYTGQPVTCYVCNSPSHMAQECPTRQKRNKDTTTTLHKTWASVVETGQTQISNTTQDSPTGAQDEREDLNRQIATINKQHEQIPNIKPNMQTQGEPVQEDCAVKTAQDRIEKKKTTI